MAITHELAMQPERPQVEQPVVTPQIDELQFVVPEQCASCPVITRIIDSVNRLTNLPEGEEKTETARQNMIHGLRVFGCHVLNECSDGVDTQEGSSTFLRKPQVTQTCQSEVQSHLPKHRISVTKDL